MGAGCDIQRKIALEHCFRQQTALLDFRPEFSDKGLLGVTCEEHGNPVSVLPFHAVAVQGSLRLGNRGLDGHPAESWQQSLLILTGRGKDQHHRQYRHSYDVLHMLAGLEGEDYADRICGTLQSGISIPRIT